MGEKALNRFNDLNKNVFMRRSVMVIIALLLTFFFALFKGLRFESNDDTLLRSIMCGDYTGIPDAHLVYIMYPLGLIFKALYTVAPSAIWFEIFLVSLFWTSIILASDSFEENSLIIFTVLTAVCFKGLLLCQYTQIAGLAAAASLICFKRKKMLPASVLFILSLWLRKETAIALIPLFLLIILWFIVNKEIKGKTALILVTTVIMAESFALNGWAYSSPEWKEYNAFNKARTDVFDYGKMPEYGKYEEFYNEIGISADEYTALVEYDLSLVEPDTDMFKAMADKYDSIIKEWNQFSNPYKRAVKGAILAFANNVLNIRGAVAVISLLLAFIVSVFDAIKKKRILTEGLIQAIASGLYFIAFISVFAALGRLPERILFGVNIMAFLFSIDAIMLCISNLEKRSSFYIIPMATVVIIALAIPIDIRGISLKVNQDEIMEERLERVYNSLDIDTVYFLEKRLYNGGRKMGNVHEPFNMVKSADWLYGSPLMKEKYEGLGIYGVFDSSANNKNCFIIPDELNADYIYNIISERKSDTEVINCTELFNR